MERTSRLIARGLRAEKRERLKQLEIKIDRLGKDINYYLYNFDGVEAMRIDHAEQAMEELVAAVREYKALSRELAEMAE
ncbi:MAG: hypothetical protein K9K36_14055 [Desulfarculaceae bacterium]|nr:hypothetical protein [Pseudomonadota bacterium]MCF8043744.1 hypothetical protein [Desulfarculaceae bacterium]MBU4278392.1 hypothetical protein [Pseudomonadota bacterium]MBU4382028.1 hypothetical protein [Pseudomonadota bacterium]MBU4604824.1 hypothetical protein [Pseudomonadota bacterium]